MKPCLCICSVTLWPAQQAGRYSALCDVGVSCWLMSSSITWRANRVTFCLLYELGLWPNPCLMRLPALLLLLLLFTFCETLHYVFHRNPVPVFSSSIRFRWGFLKGADALAAGFMHPSFKCVAHVLEAAELLWSLKVSISPLQWVYKLSWKQYLSLRRGKNRSLSSLWASAGSLSRCHQSRHSAQKLFHHS